MSKQNHRGHEPLQFPKDRDAFLNRAFEASDGYIVAGGLAHRLNMLGKNGEGDSAEPQAHRNEPGEFDTRRLALAKFVEFSRRLKGLSIEAFAAKAKVDIGDVLQVEDEDAPSPEPRAIYAIAQYLRADSRKLMVLAGHVMLRDETLDREAVRFAAWSHGSEPLSKDEEKILREFARVVVESTDRR